MQDLIAKYDHSNVLDSIIALPDQIDHAWSTVTANSYPDLSQSVNKIVLVAMGGSALGGRVIKPLFQDSLAYPLEIINNYNLPQYADTSTLVILASYSGTTEEVVSAAAQVRSRKIPAAVIAAGGSLLDLAKEYQWPYYHIDPQANPSGQPRMAIGYAITGTLALLHQCKLVNIAKTDFDQTIQVLTDNASIYLPQHSDNFAISCAQELLEKTINLVSSDHLSGATHVINNQINENGKQLTAEFIIPELNHHYLEALSYPTDAKHNQAYLCIDSTLYLPENQKRLTITKELLQKAGFTTLTFTAQSPTKLTQAFEVIQFGAFLNFYLAMLHGIDPAPIPTVDLFKTEMKKAPL